MTRLALAALLVLVAALPADAQLQKAVPAHNHMAIVGPLSGAINLLPAFVRSLLGVVNDSANVVYCTTDGTTAADGAGLRLAATGTTGDRVFFDAKVPQGPLRCYSGTHGSRLNLIEGR